MFLIMFYKLFNAYNTAFLFFRSSRPEVFCKKGALRNFAKFTGKHLCQSLIFNKICWLRIANLLKMRLLHRCFPVNFAEFLRTPFFAEHLWWLLLSLNYMFWRNSKIITENNFCLHHKNMRKCKQNINCSFSK